MLYGERGIAAFEVKDYPMAKAYFLYGGQRRMHDGSIEIIPVNDALKELPAILSRG